MTWFKVCDTFAFHRKAVRCAQEALGLWAVAGSWCAAQLTDGVVPRDMLPALRGTEAMARELVRVRLWDEHADGWRFHNWEDYQPTREEVANHRDRLKRIASAGGKASSEKRRINQRTQPARSTSVVEQTGEPPRSTTVPNHAAELSVPSRPVPSQPDPSSLRSEDPPQGGAPGGRVRPKHVRQDQAGYMAQAFADGVSDAKGPKFSVAKTDQWALDDAIDANGPHASLGAQEAWTREAAAAWTRWRAALDDAERRFAPASVAGFIRWLNEGRPSTPARGRDGPKRAPVIQERNREIENSPTAGKGWFPQKPLSHDEWIAKINDNSLFDDEEKAQ